MNKFLIAFLFILIGAHLPLHGENRYSSRITQDGTIFFIDPHKLNHTENIKNFTFDVTLLTWSDSVTVNFTFESKLMTRPESLEIISGGDSYKCDSYKPLYIDLKKNRFEIRISSTFPLSSFKKIIESQSPPVFQFLQNSVICSATYSASAWRKEQKKLHDILQLFLYSK